MTEQKLSQEELFQKHHIKEDIADALFYYWDVNSWEDFEHCLNEVAEDLPPERLIMFLVDVLKYIHQTEFDLFERGERRYVGNENNRN